MVAFADLGLPVACLVTVAGESELHRRRGSRTLEVAGTLRAAHHTQDTQPRDHGFHDAEILEAE
jgi:hypothetical protein